MITMTLRFGATMMDGLEHLGAGSRYEQLAQAARYLRAWITVSRERAHLARLDASQLEDLGLTQRQAWLESERPFWMLNTETRHRFGIE